MLHNNIIQAPHGALIQFHNLITFFLESRPTDQHLDSAAAITALLNSFKSLDHQLIVFLQYDNLPYSTLPCLNRNAAISKITANSTTTNGSYRARYSPTVNIDSEVFDCVCYAFSLYLQHLILASSG